MASLLRQPDSWIAEHDRLLDCSTVLQVLSLRCELQVHSIRDPCAVERMRITLYRQLFVPQTNNRLVLALKKSYENVLSDARAYAKTAAWNLVNGALESGDPQCDRQVRLRRKWPCSREIKNQYRCEDVQQYYSENF